MAYGVSNYRRNVRAVKLVGILGTYPSSFRKPNAERFCRQGPSFDKLRMALAAHRA